MLISRRAAVVRGAHKPRHSSVDRRWPSTKRALKQAARGWTGPKTRKRHPHERQLTPVANTELGS